jgi:hypothetical protein
MTKSGPMLDFSRAETVLRIGYECAAKTLARLPEDSPLWKVRGPRSSADRICPEQLGRPAPEGGPGRLDRGDASIV